MKARLTAFALVALASTAHANEIIDIPFSGSETHTFASYECNYAHACTPGTTEDRPWTGEIQLTVDDALALVSFTLTSTAATWDIIDRKMTGPFFAPQPVFQDGVLTGIAGPSFGTQDVKFGTDATSLVMNTSALVFDEGLPSDHGSATMTLPAVPEPSTYALLLAGVAFTGRALRSRRNA
jgi:hypothetical protein